MIVRDDRLRWPVPRELPGLLPGLVLADIGRRGKYLLFDFGRGWLIAHLGMSGSIRVLAGDGGDLPAPSRHDHVDIVFDGATMRYQDARRFGAMLWHPREAGPLDGHPLLARLGVEPLSEDFDGARLHAGTRGRVVGIKQLLLAGRVVVGVGNIYASESLYRAGIRPGTPAARLSRRRCDTLARCIRLTLEEAIAFGGSTLKDFVAADGARGGFQRVARVYGRAGQPCQGCGTPIRVRHDQQRATYYCPRCQT